jgi:hypothetical protein
MPATASPANWTQLANASNPYIPPGFTGKVVLNCHEGAVVNVQVQQTFSARPQGSVR